MRFSALPFRPSKTAPADSPTKNARLLVQAGFARQIGGGIYAYLPLGLKVLKKIEAVVRDEMTRVGGAEILMPALHPRNFWEKTGRWDTVDVLFRLDGQAGEFALGSTHEEIVTPLVGAEIKSYRDLPAKVFQIQTKFRDEARAKSGLLRGREFVMKDFYSFHADRADLEDFYEKMKTAYFEVFRRCGLGEKTVATTASGGAFSKKFSHEFQTFTDAGEDTIAVCEKCGSAQNLEVAAGVPDEKNLGDAEKPLAEIPADRGASIDESVRLHGLAGPWQVLKSVIFRTSDGEIVGVVVRGDLAVSADKVARMLGVEVAPAGPEDLEKIGAAPGFISPVGENAPKIRWLGDPSIRTMKNFSTGANAPKMDLENANLGRDFEVEEWGDFAEIAPGFGCAEKNCPGKISLKKAAEVGNIFDLGTKFSDAFGLTFLDENGARQPVVMGCYGIGISRLVAVVAEVFADDRGLVWPREIAPFAVHLVALPGGENAAEELYKNLETAGVETLFDDRPARAGEKFADADLIGIPTRVVVSGRGVEAGTAEVRDRATGEEKIIPLGEMLDFLKK